MALGGSFTRGDAAHNAELSIAYNERSAELEARGSTKNIRASALGKSGGDG
jgi:hypothetical protein